MKTARAGQGEATNRVAAANGNGAHAETVNVTISAPNIRIIPLPIRGTAPYVGNKFSQKAREAMAKGMEEGSRGRKGKKREPRDFDADYRGAMHVSTEGWYGIPASAFRNGMIDACRLVDFKMTLAKQCLFVVADGLDADDGQPLIRIYGEPQRVDLAVRNSTGVPDIRARPQWREWSATVRVRYDADKFSETDVANLVLRVGEQVGIGAGRPFSKDSAGLGWGTFTITEHVA
jgi:hypothetical protein